MKILAKATFYFLLMVLCFSSSTGQILQFASSFSQTGDLIGIDTVFKYNANGTKVSCRFSNGAPIPTDTLFVIVKSVNGISGRYYMKRSKSKMNANALLKFHSDGIYRVYVYHPNQKQSPLATGKVYITSNNYPTVASLIEYQKKILIAKGEINNGTTVANKTANPANTKTVTASNNTKPSNSTSSSIIT
ncbi:MAG: hypothetical protein NZ108_05000, partial [Bacteroidia bacterium]|nr:hypothetical protein [Bacteroidia bacterium]